MGAPSPELCNLWLARAFNAQDVEADAAMYHPEASIVQVDQVHGGTKIARGADGIRETMAAYIGMKPHMDVVTHHTTVAGDFAMTRSQWLIKGHDKDGRPIEVHHHGMEVHRRLPDGTWVFFIDHPFGADPSWAVEAPPRTEQHPSARAVFAAKGENVWLGVAPRPHGHHAGDAGAGEARAEARAPSASG